MSVFEVRDRSWLFDFCLAVGVSLLAAVFVGSDGETMIATVVLCSSLMLRRSQPAAALALGVLGALGLLAFAGAPSFAVVVVPLLIYGLARWSSARLGQLALVAGLIGSVLGPLRWTGPVNDGDSFAPFAMTAVASGSIVVGSYLLGSRLREAQQRQRERRDEAVRERVLVEAEQQQRAQVATISERARIARELHDIVAHSLSVIVVQAEGGRAVVLKRPEVGAQVLDTIAETGRASLAEMRRIVDLLRGGETDPSYLPSPGVEDIAELVARSGERFELTTFGAAPPVSPALGLTAYRVVQESLTNVIKHAGPLAAARVTVAYTSQTIEIEVTDDGRGAAAGGSADGSPTLGHGLRGMGERVALLHGTLDARPRPGGGFTVRASLPLASDDAAARSAPESGE
jgi:signal transduction histidine kinase